MRPKVLRTIYLFIYLYISYIYNQFKRKKKEREKKKSKVGSNNLKISSSSHSKIYYKYSLPTSKLSRVNKLKYSIFPLSNSLFSRDLTMEVDPTTDNNRFPDFQESSYESSPNLPERKLRRNDSLDVESRTVPGAAGAHGHKVDLLAFFSLQFS